MKTMKRPTMPDMKPTGINTANSESVVAMTARQSLSCPQSRPEMGAYLFFDEAVDVFENDDSVVNNDAYHPG